MLNLPSIRSEGIKYVLGGRGREKFPGIFGAISSWEGNTTLKPTGPSEGSRKNQYGKDFFQEKDDAVSHRASAVLMKSKRKVSVSVHG